MTLPKFEDVMLPMLEFLKDGEEKTYSQIIVHVKNIFNLSDEDIKQVTPSGGNSLRNKIGWSKVYLTRVNFLEKRRAKFKISSSGLDLLKEKPSKIDRPFLNKLRERNAGQSTLSTNPTIPDPMSPDQSTLNTKSPDEIIDEGISEINALLRDDLLEKLHSVDPTFFEKMVIDVIEKLGYGTKNRTSDHVGQSGDKGIDGIIYQDKLGLQKIYLQAKRYASNVPAQDIRDFLGALSMKQTTDGIFITTSDFPKSANDDISKSDKNIILMNGNQLVKHMIENNVGIKITKSIHLKEIDEEYFE